MEHSRKSAADHEHLPCCHCCARCHPPLNVEEGKCAICPAFGRVCSYGLPPDDEHLIISHTTQTSGAQWKGFHRANSAQKPRPAAIDVPTEPINDSRFNIHRSAVQVYGQQMYVPMVPLVHMVPLQSLQGSQCYVQMPFGNFMVPRLAQSTMVPSDMQIPS